MKALRQATVAATLVLVAVPAAADAKVYVAPNSPAGFQYGAPLESARREGAGGQGIAGAPGAAERAPVFGKGVGDSAGAPGDRPGGKPASEDGSSAPALKRTQGDDGNAGLRVAGLTLGVLAVGLLAGLGLRRRSAPAPG